MTAKTITDLAVLFEHATAALNACIDRGMQLPFILCAVAPNGSVAAIRTDGVERELLVEHIEPEGFRLPITILVLDHAGEAGKFHFEPPLRPFPSIGYRVYVFAPQAAFGCCARTAASGPTATPPLRRHGAGTSEG